MPQETQYDLGVSDSPKEKIAPSGATSNPRRRLLWVLLILGVVVIVGGVFAWRYLSSYESTDDAQVDGHVNAISTRVSGYVLKVNIDDNQYVEKGAVLVEIDPRDYQVAVEKAKADLSDAIATAQALNLNVPVESVGTTTQVSSTQADLLTAEAGADAAQKQLEAAQAELAEAEANNARAQADAVRYRALVVKDEVSKQLFDQADATAKADAAAVDGARASVAAAEQQVMQAKGRVAQAQAAVEYSRTGPQQVAATKARAEAALAAVEQKRAALDAAQLDLQYCTVTAPVTGVVSKNVEVGMNVQPGQTLLSLVPLDDVWVTANFKETQLRDMHPGQPVTFSVDAFARTYHGQIQSIAGATGSKFSLLPPENATGNYVKVVQRVPVKIVLNPGENDDHKLRLGMSVEPKVWLR